MIRNTTLRLFLTTALALAITVMAAAADHVIKMKRRSEVYYLTCEINGAKKDFIFDTGAAKTSLSQELVNEMLKNGKLQRTDFKGTTQTRNASGIVDNNAIVNIRQLKVGNRLMYNVEAVVATSQKAPLLLGLNAIDLLGRWSMQKGYLILYDNMADVGTKQQLQPTRIYDIDDGASGQQAQPQQPAQVTGNATMAVDRLRAYHGDPEAQYNLGMSYFEGNGEVQSNLEIAVIWFTKAAQAGHREAQLTLANCYLNGWGVEQNAEQAQYWRDMAMQGDDYSDDYSDDEGYDPGSGTTNNDDDRQ